MKKTIFMSTVVLCLFVSYAAAEPVEEYYDLPKKAWRVISDTLESFFERITGNKSSEKHDQRKMTCSTAVLFSHVVNEQMEELFKPVHQEMQGEDQSSFLNSPWMLKKYQGLSGFFSEDDREKIQTQHQFFVLQVLKRQEEQENFETELGYYRSVELQQEESLQSVIPYILKGQEVAIDLGKSSEGDPFRAVLLKMCSQHLENPKIERLLLERSKTTLQLAIGTP